jgi:oligopeptide/dipeptide ABC transporter ATP-binding protein
MNPAIMTAHANAAPEAVPVPVLDIADLHIGFRTRHGVMEVVRGVDLTIATGEAVALVGESGSGKSMTALGIMRLLPRDGAILSGHIRLSGDDLGARGESAMARLRGRDIAMIFQDPLSALNPSFTIGRQITDAIRAHQDIGMAGATDRAAELLSLVGITSPRSRLGSFPHEFSGGMRQRVAIAIAVACQPRLLIADEPTTALDVTVQGQVIELLRDLRQRLGIAILFISHNLDLVAEICDRVAVMYAGRIVETNRVEAIFTEPRHPYTRQLLRCIPRLSDDAGPLATIAGEPPGFGVHTTGCPFAPRCERVEPRCHASMPPVTGTGAQRAMCWLAA